MADTVFKMSARAPKRSQLDTLIANSLHLRDRTKQLYRDCVAEFVAFAGDDPRAYSPGIVEDWLASMKARAPQTVNVYRKAVRFASKRWAKYQTDDEPRRDFAANVDKVKSEPSEVRVPLTYDEAAALIATCNSDDPKDIRDRALIVLALRSGLRSGGIRALQIDGIRGTKITTVNKGGKPLVFEADAETLALLAAWIKKLKSAGIMTGPVFRVVSATTIGQPMSLFQVWHVFSSRSKAAKIRHVFPHLVRHSTVTWLREQGKSAAEVRNLTGQSERTIENIYSHVRSQGAVGAVLPSFLPSTDKSVASPAKTLRKRTKQSKP
jgi:integrase